MCGPALTRSRLWQLLRTGTFGTAEKRPNQIDFFQQILWIHTRTALRPADTTRGQRWKEDGVRRGSVPHGPQMEQQNSTVQATMEPAQASSTPAPHTSHCHEMPHYFDSLFIGLSNCLGKRKVSKLINVNIIFLYFFMKKETDIFGLWKIHNIWEHSLGLWEHWSLFFFFLTIILNLTNLLIAKITDKWINNENDY